MSSGYHRMGANVRKKNLKWDNRLMVPFADGDAPVALIAPDDAGPSIGFHAKIKDPTPITDPIPALSRDAAQQQGYTGDQCSNCFSMRMQVAGHCMVCADCGTTTGCS